MSGGTGHGAPVLFLHGAGVAGWMWRPVLQRLGDDIAPLVPDLPGFGKRAHQPYESHQSTVAMLADELRRSNPERAHLVGFSLGAQLAILLAAEHPDLVRGVTVVSAEVLPVPLPRFTLRLVAATAPLARQRWFARAQARQLAVPEELIAHYVHDSAMISTRTLVAAVEQNLNFRLPTTWGTVRPPVVVLVGARERTVMKRSAHLVADAVPHSTLREIDGAGHDIPFTRPDDLAATIRASTARSE